MSASGIGSSGTISAGRSLPGRTERGDTRGDLAGRLGSRLLLVHAVPLPLPSREAGVAPPTCFVMVDRTRDAGAALLEEIAGSSDPAWRSSGGCRSAPRRR